MNILYLGDINSIHDFKWCSFFSEKDDFNVYFLTEIENHNQLSDEKRKAFDQAGINILPPIHNFSFSKPVKCIKSIKSLRRHVKQNRIDLFHALFGSPQAIWLNFLPAKLSKIITTRGSDVLVLLKNVINSSGFLNMLLEYLLIKGIKKADFIVSTSDKQIDFLLDQGIKKSQLKLIKTGVDVERIKNHPIEEKFKTKTEKFVFSARYIDHVYNMEYQLEAIKSLPVSFLESYSFLFVRKRGDNSNFYKSFITKLNEVPHLTFDICEGLTQNQMWATLKASSVTYMVPKSDGTPNTALECMAAKVPLIMGDLDYNKELFNGVCLSTQLDNSDDLALQIQKACSNYPENLLNKAYFIVEEFGNRTVEMNKLKELYLSLNV